MSTVRERGMAQIDKAKGVALSGYATAKEATQDTLQTGLDKTQHTFVNGWKKVQEWLHALGQRSERPVITKARGRTRRSAQSTLQTTPLQAQKTVQKGLNRAQDVVSKQTMQASAALTKAQHKLSETWSGVQDTLDGMQGTLQDNTQATKAKFSKTLDKGTKKASKQLAKATSTVKEMKDTVQDNYKHAARKRRRARNMFRWGLVIGVVLALLYTPKPGAEMRTQLATWWQNNRTRLGL